MDQADELRSPSLPKYFSLMSPKRQVLIEGRGKRMTSIASQMSGISVASSTVSDFLEDKVAFLGSEVDIIKTYRDGLLKAQKVSDISDDDFQVELRKVTAKINILVEHKKVLTRQKRFIEEDLEDEVFAKKKKDIRDEPDTDFIERAYANTIIPRVMGASSKQPKNTFTKHDQARFRERVLDYYGASQKRGEASRAFCHLTGSWWESRHVKAAHLVPKQLSGEELSFLFGVQETPLHDPRNGISLYNNIEAALDQGKIVIVPVPSEDSPRTKWKCVLVDKALSNQVAIDVYDIIVKWKDLDGKELKFVTENRPAKRFLYFRFIITYLWAKMKGQTSFTSSVEGKKDFWASPGAYLRQSTLTSLARNISGLELPPSIFSNTFEDEVEDEELSASESDTAGTCLSVLLREAICESSKNKGDLDTDDSEDDDDFSEDNE